MSTAEQFRKLNQMVEQFIAGLQAGTANINDPTLSSIFDAMCHCAGYLPELTASDSPELKREVNSYKKNLGELKRMLRAVEGLLLAEKARLCARRSQLQMAAEWLTASRSTL